MARVALLLALVLLPWPAAAADWGGIEPGVSTVAGVRERYGAPSKESRPTVEGYDTLTWVYEGGRAPAGIARLTVDFGLLTPAGYKPDVVRVFTLEPKPAIFGRATVFQGWGLPDRKADNPDGTVMFTWHDGLIVTFDKTGEQALTMTFSMPQPALGPRASPAPTGPQPAAPAPRR